MLSNIFSVVAPISVDNVDLVKLWSNIVRHLIRIQSFDNKTFCIQVCVQGKFQKSRFHCVILKRASSLPAIFISLIIESIFLALYIYFFDLSPTTPANEISKSKVADFRFQRCIFNNTHFPYPSRIPFCVSG